MYGCSPPNKPTPPPPPSLLPLGCPCNWMSSGCSLRKTVGEMDIQRVDEYMDRRGQGERKEGKDGEGVR